MDGLLSVWEVYSIGIMKGAWQYEGTDGRKVAKSYILIHRLREFLGLAWATEILKPTRSSTLLPRCLPTPNLINEFYSLVTEHSNIWAYVAHSYSNHNHHTWTHHLILPITSSHHALSAAVNYWKLLKPFFLPILLAALCFHLASHSLLGPYEDLCLYFLFPWYRLGTLTLCPTGHCSWLSSWSLSLSPHPPFLYLPHTSFSESWESSSHTQTYTTVCDFGVGTFANCTIFLDLGVCHCHSHL